MTVRKLALGLWGPLAVGAEASAQERTGSIAGAVKDSSGAHSPRRHRPGDQPVARRHADGGRRRAG